MAKLVSSRMEGSALIIEIDNPPVNASSKDVRTGLMDELEQAASRSDVTAIILCCAGRTFMCGADISEFDLEALPRPDPNEVHALIEKSRIPVIAALHGTVLGGGLELALSCHGRIALRSTKLGLPEVNLGVVPGSGGTQRLPRLVGAASALEMMVSGRPVDADKALSLGLIDSLVEDDLIHNALLLANEIAQEDKPLSVIGKLPVAADTAAAAVASRKSLPDADRGGLAAHAIIDCVESGIRLSFDDALNFEREVFERCKRSPESQALRHLFFAEREAARIPGLPSNVRAREITSVGIIGAGTMGGGIAMSFANADIQVTIVEVDETALARGIGLVTKNYEASAAKGRLTRDQVTARLGLISGSIDYDDISECDLVIEAAYENMDVKRGICERLGEVCNPDTIIATNTSSLDVNILAAASGRPEQFVGMHFFSPANIMKLLEVVRGDFTAPSVLATVLAIAKRIGKVPVVSGVCFGFIGNRMLEGYLRETEALLLEGASPAQIDRAIEATGMAMGPCKMIDMAGVDVAAKVVLEQEQSGILPADPAYRVVVQTLFEKGRFGQKSGAGYYHYDGRKPVEDPDVTAICKKLADQHAIVRRNEIPDSEIIERCLLPLVNEGAKILEEGIAYRPGDIDVIWANGYGFPAYRGGPMHSAKVMGYDNFIGRLTHYASKQGNAYDYWTASKWFKGQAIETDPKLN